MTEADARELIHAERQRQISAEGYDHAHDDEHHRGEIMSAAMCYLGHSTGTASYRDDGAPETWPWERHYWKPKDRIRDLARSGALMLAERDRRERAGIGALDVIDHKIGIVVRELCGRQAGAGDGRTA